MKWEGLAQSVGPLYTHTARSDSVLNLSCLEANRMQWVRRLWVWCVCYSRRNSITNWTYGKMMTTLPVSEILQLISIVMVMKGREGAWSTSATRTAHVLRNMNTTTFGGEVHSTALSTVSGPVSSSNRHVYSVLCLFSVSLFVGAAFKIWKLEIFWNLHLDQAFGTNQNNLEAPCSHIPKLELQRAGTVLLSVHWAGLCDDNSCGLYRGGAGVDPQTVYYLCFDVPVTVHRDKFL